MNKTYSYKNMIKYIHSKMYILSSYLDFLVFKYVFIDFEVTDLMIF